MINLQWFERSRLCPN